MINSRIFLIGLMGAGKTTVGRLLAQHLQFNFVDTDELIIAQEGKSTRDLFAARGEAYFRQLESYLVSSVAKYPNTVLATGGGVILEPHNRRILQKGWVCYLKVSTERQIVRLKDSHTRALLPAADNARRRFLTQMAAQRDELYASIANFTYNTDDVAADQIALELTNHLLKL